MRKSLTLNNVTFQCRKIEGFPENQADIYDRWIELASPQNHFMSPLWGRVPEVEKPGSMRLSWKPPTTGYNPSSLTHTAKHLTYLLIPASVEAQTGVVVVSRRLKTPAEHFQAAALQRMFSLPANNCIFRIFSHQQVTSKQHNHIVSDLSSNTHTCARAFNGPLSGTTQVGRYQKGKTNQDFTEARDSEWQWHQLSHMQVCTSLQTDNQASFLQARCPSCRPTNSVKALKELKDLSSKRYR